MEFYDATCHISQLRVYHSIATCIQGNTQSNFDFSICTYIIKPDNAFAC